MGGQRRAETFADLPPEVQQRYGSRGTPPARSDDEIFRPRGLTISAPKSAAEEMYEQGHRDGYDDGFTEGRRGRAGWGIVLMLMICALVAGMIAFQYKVFDPIAKYFETVTSAAADPSPAQAETAEEPAAGEADATVNKTARIEVMFTTNGCAGDPCESKIKAHAKDFDGWYESCQTPGVPCVVFAKLIRAKVKEVKVQAVFDKPGGLPRIRFSDPKAHPHADEVVALMWSST